jgi:hypothetical protein
MIVCPVAGGLQLVTQPDHARLAGRIMEQCVALTGRPRRGSLLLAIAEHDNGWAEEDAAPSADPRTGAIVDFTTAPVSVRHAVWPRAVTRLAHDPWAAALVAQHAIAVHERFHADPDWAMFFAGMAAARDEMLQASGTPLDDFAADYTFVRLADVISLSFCAGWTDEQRVEEWTVRLSGTRVVVTPDPFGGALVPFDVEARVIRRGPFRSDAELREALRAAHDVTLRGEAAGTG